MKTFTLDLTKYRFRKERWKRCPFTKKYLMKNRKLKVVKGSHQKEYDYVFEDKDVEDKIKKEMWRANGYMGSLDLPMGTNMSENSKCIVIRDGRKIVDRGLL